MIKSHRKSAFRMAAAGVLAAASVWVCAEGTDGGRGTTQSAARGGQGAPARPAASTFRLLTFEVGNSGPRLGATTGNGEQDIVDVHNAILRLGPQTIAYFSERMTLLPGDLIATGVPQPTMSFAEGDTVEITVGHLGTLRNRVVSKPLPGHEKFPPRKVSSPERR